MIQMWITFAIIAIAIVFYVTQWLAMEVISLGVIIALLLLFNFIPAPDNPIIIDDLLAGFANPALITILALMVIGQGLHQSGALANLSYRLQGTSKEAGKKLVWLCVIAAGIVSAFMNNTPVVVIFIPILSTLANRFGPGASRILIPLSFVTILGGMTTLIGSSTNLLVASVASIHLNSPISFFDFLIPGLILATVGCLFTVFVIPHLLTRSDAAPDTPSIITGKQFLGEIEITNNHPFNGLASVSGMFPGLEGVTVRLVMRGTKDILPPFEDVVLGAGDVVLAAGTRATITDLLNLANRIAQKSTDETDATAQNNTADNDELADKDQELSTTVIAEAAVAPGSHLQGRFLVQTPFQAQTGCRIVGIQRHRRMLRLRLDNIRMQAGDVLLIAGPRQNVQNLSTDRDLLVLGGTMETLPEFANARTALAIFAITVFTAATGLLPIVISALLGASAMLLSSCINIQQAARALDRNIIFLVAASIAMATALDVTGGAKFIAESMLALLSGASPTVILSAMFLLIAISTNILSNNATALLFTPIALSMAESLNLNAHIFIHMVIFAANCSFASPIGYQTNLLVMGPGNYRFIDFIRVGVPLLLIMWLTFSLMLPLYYGL